MSVEAHTVKVFQDRTGQWRWTARDSNGEPVADSDESYKNHQHTLEAARSLFPAAEIDDEGAME